MYSNNASPPPYHLIPLKPGTKLGLGAFGIGVISFLTMVILGLLLVAFVPQTGNSTSAASKVPLKIDKDPAPANLAEFKNGYAPVIDPALPAVVNISSTKMVKQQNDNSPGFSFDDPFFRQFFGNQSNEQPAKPQTEREYSLGSGVIVNPDGYILTNNHVVSGASDIEVFTQDKKKFRAKLIGADSRTDVAVIKIDATRLPSLTLGDSSNLKVGDVVFAIGDPFGVGETATMGIVSATGRGLGGAIEHYEDFIQTDAAINPGNSGGALLDLHGDLVGINTAIVTGGSGGNQGVGLAIPIDMARNVMEQIVDHGKVVRGHLGVSIQSVDADMAKAFGLNQGGGALVGDVTPGSPAAKAGIERGDIILELNGKTVSEPDDLSLHIAETAPGTTVHLKISRNGQTHDINVVLDELSEADAAAVAGGDSGPTALRGVQVQNLTPTVARDLGISAKTAGVLITGVDPSSVAAAAGLQRGDVIQEVNRKPVRNVEEYDRALAGAHDQSILLLVSRGQATRFVVVQPN
jgi:serine protease Do